MSEYEYEYDYDSLLYEKEEESPDMKLLCSRHEIGLMLLAIEKAIVDALNKGIRIVIDVEPVQYESALSLLSTIVYCSRMWDKIRKIHDKHSNSYITLDFSMYVVPSSSSKTISVLIDRERKKDEIADRIELVLSRSRLIYFLVTSKPPEINITTGVYYRNLILDSIRKTLKVFDEKYGKETNVYREKIKYVGRVPHEVVLLMPLENVVNVARTWEPPPPSNSDYLRETPRTLDSLILSPEFKNILKQYTTILSEEGSGSLLLVGLPGAGRKTIAKALALELEQPSYIISVANILSRYVGESESKLRAFFDSMRARGGLAVFESVDVIFRKGGSESVTPNLRSILFQEMAREDNNFVIVFTTNEEAPSMIFDSPLLGEVKLVIPLPTRDMRRELARQFLKEIAGDEWPTLLELSKKIIGGDDEEAEKILYSTYADVFVDRTIGYTPGEIYRTMRIILKPALQEMMKKQRIVDITNEAIKFTRRDVSARQAKIKTLIDRAIKLGWFSIAEELEKVYDELTKYALEHGRQKKRF